MKNILCVLFTLAAVVASASPVTTFALVVDSHGSVGADGGLVHSGQRLSASSDLSVPAGSKHVDLQLTGDATYAADDSSPMASPASATMIRVEPGSDLSLSQLQATDTGIGTVHRINLRLKHGSVLVLARRLVAPSSLNLLAPAGRISIFAGTVKVSAHSIAVAAGRAVFYPNATGSKDTGPIVLTSGHSYDTGVRAISPLSATESSAITRQAREFHPVGPAHLSSGNDYTKDCLSPIHPHPGHHHHPHHHHHEHAPHPHHPGPSDHHENHHPLP